MMILNGVGGILDARPHRVTVARGLFQMFF